MTEVFVVYSWNVLACEPEDAMEDFGAVSIKGVFSNTKKAQIAIDDIIREHLESYPEHETLRVELDDQTGYYVGDKHELIKIEKNDVSIGSVLNGLVITLSCQTIE